MLEDWQLWVSAAISVAFAVLVGLLRVEDKLGTYLRYWTPGRLNGLRAVVAVSHAVVGAIGAGVAINADWFPATSSPLWLLNGVAYGAGAVALFRADISEFTLSGAASGRSVYQLVESTVRKRARAAATANVKALVHGANDERLLATSTEILIDVYHAETKPLLGASEITRDIGYAALVLDGDVAKIDPPIVGMPLSTAQDQWRSWLRDLVVSNIERHQLTFEKDSDWAATKALWDAD